MAAIAAVLGAPGEPARGEDLRSLLAAQRALGPDGTASWCGAGAALGRAALVTTPDPSGAHGFLRREEADLAVAADLRLDNREEILDALGLPPAEAPGDAALLLRAWERWEEGFVDRIRGDWAAALWDGRRRTLVLSRDVHGTRPLYWTAAGGRFAAASSARALLRLGWAAPRLRESRVADALVDILELHAPEETFWEGVHRLPAAHLMVVTPGGRRSRRYWDLLAAAEAGPAVAAAEAVEGFREAFLRAVGARLRASPPAGSMLSGGLDSGAIACAAREVLRRSGGPPLRTFSCVSDDGAACIETPRLRAVLEGGGLEPDLLRTGEAGRYAAAWRSLPAAFEEPFEAGAVPVPLLLYLRAREAGVRVLLDGVDGDLATSLDEECVGHAAADGKWAEAWDLARGFGGEEGVPAAALLWRHVLRPRAPAFLRRLRRSLRRVDPAGELLASSLLDPEAARRLGVRGRLETLLEGLHGDRGRGAAAARRHFARRAGALWIAPAAERYGRAAAACGVEARHPFADRRLVEFCARVPYGELVRGGRVKSLLRRALDPLLPPAVRDQRRSGANLNPAFLAALLRARGEDAAADFGEALGALAGIVAAGPARARWAAFRAGGGGEDAGFVEQVLLLGGWVRAVRAAPPG